MRARVANYHPRTTFHTVSPRTLLNKGIKKGRGCWTPALTVGGKASLLIRRRTEDLRSISGTDGSHPLHLGLIGLLIRLGRHCKCPCRLSYFPDEALQTPRRKDEQQPRRSRVNREGVGNVLGSKEIGARPCLYRLIAHVESHLAFEDVETFILLMMDVQHAPVAIRSEYLYQGVLPAGLLPGNLYGGQHP